MRGAAKVSQAVRTRSVDRIRLQLQAASHRLPSWVGSLFRFFGSFVLALFIWLILSNVVSEAFVPAPKSVAAAFADMMTKGILPTYVVDSVRHVALASIAGIAIGVPLGLVIGMNRWVARFFKPLLSFFQALSGIAWLPMLMIWFGFTERAIVASVLYTVLFPVIFNTVVGVSTVPRVFINATRTMGGNAWRVARDVIVPGALPNIVVGVRLGIAYGWRAMIGAEMLVGANGLGFLIFDARTSAQTPRIVLGMLVIGSLWMILDQMLLRPFERITVERWGLVRS
jgi:taurine transport system permease protein